MPINFEKILKSLDKEKTGYVGEYWVGRWLEVSRSGLPMSINNMFCLDNPQVGKGDKFTILARVDSRPTWKLEINYPEKLLVLHHKTGKQVVIPRGLASMAH